MAAFLILSSYSLEYQIQPENTPNFSGGFGKEALQNQRSLLRIFARVLTKTGEEGVSLDFV